MSFQEPTSEREAEAAKKGVAYWERWVERASILEYDCGLPREEAERAATKECEA